MAIDAFEVKGWRRSIYFQDFWVRQDCEVAAHRVDARKSITRAQMERSYLDPCLERTTLQALAEPCHEMRLHS